MLRARQRDFMQGERMNHQPKLFNVILCVFASMVFLAPAHGAFADDMKHGVVSPDKLAWGLFDPSQPDGLKIAVLYGDPSKPGPFAVRLKIPAGLELGSHTHTNAEYVTIVSGKAKVSWGIKADVMGGDDLAPGSFFWMGGGDHHDLKAIEETVVELHSTGPDLLPDK
jgi:mannose-6-phosphate isomerase-like protein (cupin superfamily)